MKTCLVVDDSRVVRIVARKMLEELSFEVSEAEHGKEALEICYKELPDFILLDWHMPEMDGIEFLKEMRSLPNGSDPVVIVCSTENDISHIQQALIAGANEYVMKPFDSDILQSKLEQVGLL